MDGFSTKKNKIDTRASKLTGLNPATFEKGQHNKKIQGPNCHTKAPENIKTEITKKQRKTLRQAKKLPTKMQCKSHRPRGSTRTTTPRGVVPYSLGKPLPQ